MKILLAPMEGVIDPVMRDLLTALGGLTHCATEFIRITNQLLPPQVYYRYCPELLTGGRTRSGVPVFVQLLGSDPAWLAANANRAAALGAPGVDLNFGCPAKTVNRHDGGAALLKCPDRLFRIIERVREAVPAEIPVTAKIRLGYDSPLRAVELACAVQAGGATWLSVHARTKTDAYRPPAHWEWLRRIRDAVKIEVIANGDIWSLSDYRRCLDVSGCSGVMLGRGIVARPDLARQISTSRAALQWEDIQSLLMRFYLASTAAKNEQHGLCRLKQWARLLGRNYAEAQSVFEFIKREKTGEAVLAGIYKQTAMRYPTSKENNYVYDQSPPHSCGARI